MKELVFTLFTPFGGAGGGALGFQQAEVTLLDRHARWQVLGGIDFDPHACRDYELLTGVAQWCEDVEHVTAQDLRRRIPRRPDGVIMSPPCKAASKLITDEKAQEPTYQKMMRLAIVWTKTMLAAWADDLPPLILFENVPNITSAKRGKEIVLAVRRALRGAGYVTHEGFHDCGEIGGLAQHRKRFLMVARLPKKIPPLLYVPPKLRVRGCGEVLGELPMPEDVEAGGAMHQMPRCQWLTWIRLSLVPPGGDHRDIDGVLAKGQARRAVFRRYHLEDWAKPSVTIGGPGTNGPFGVADPRVEQAVAVSSNRHRHAFNVCAWDEPSKTVTCSPSPSSGSPAIADPRVDARGWFGGVYGVKNWEEPFGVIAARSNPTNGCYSVADPRVKRAFDRGQSVLDWDEPSPTVAAGSYPGQGAYSVADPRRTVTLIDGGPLVVDDVTKAPEEPPIILTADGTWHRPLTTLELAALQGMPTRVAGAPLVLSGVGPSVWRETIGNIIPPPAARAIGIEMLVSLVHADAEAGILRAGSVWVEAPDMVEPGRAELVQ